MYCSFKLGKLSLSFPSYFVCIVVAEQQPSSQSTRTLVAIFPVFLIPMCVFLR